MLLFSSAKYCVDKKNASSIFPEEHTHTYSHTHMFVWCIFVCVCGGVICLYLYRAITFK